MKISTKKGLNPRYPWLKQTEKFQWAAFTLVHSLRSVNIYHAREVHKAYLLALDSMYKKCRQELLLKDPGINATAKEKITYADSVSRMRTAYNLAHKASVAWHKGQRLKYLIKGV